MIKMCDIIKILAEASEKRLENDLKNVPFEAMRRAAENTANNNNNGKYRFREAIKNPGLSFICEVKKASPSKGIIAEDFNHTSVAADYAAAGADAISVLTEPTQFLGADSYLSDIANFTKIPLLRKDFTVSDYQIYQAKTLGASAVLLIVSITGEHLREYIEVAESVGMDALVECHDISEIETAVNAGAHIIGVNNRNLSTFDVDTENAGKLRSYVPAGTLFVSESGVKTDADIITAKKIHADAVLVGETLMKLSKTDRRELIKRWRTLT
jgi:indole-3-glycerol phosphate synthase